MYSAKTISLYLINKSDGDCPDFSLLKLLKVLYFAQGYYLGGTGNRLFEDPIYAWRLGPVVKSVYDKFKGYGMLPLCHAFEENEMFKRETRSALEELNYKDREFLDAIYKKYKDVTAERLVELTHEKDGPWYNTYMPATQNGLYEVRGLEIAPLIIKEHFYKQLNAVGAY